MHALCAAHFKRSQELPAVIPSLSILSQVQAADAVVHADMQQRRRVSGTTESTAPER